MEQPIKLERDHFVSIVACMMLKHGLTEFTMTFEEYQDLMDSTKGLETVADYTSGNPWPDYLRVILV